MLARALALNCLIYRMIVENAKIVEIAESHVVVETIQQSTCGGCSARKGCGNGVLADYLSSSSYFKISTEKFDSGAYQLGDELEIGIDELALVRASLWLYLVPLIGLMTGAYVGHLSSQLASIVMAVIGLLVGGYLSSLHAKRVRHDPKYVPSIVVNEDVVRLI